MVCGPKIASLWPEFCSFRLGVPHRVARFLQFVAQKLQVVAYILHPVLDDIYITCALWPENCKFVAQILQPIIACGPYFASLWPKNCTLGAHWEPTVGPRLEAYF